MYRQLIEINKKPAPFESITTLELWTDPHRAEQMLAYHLSDATELASRSTGQRQASTNWMIQHFGIKSGTRVCDFGCGPGLYTQAFARADAKVTGVDFSTNSLQYARTQARKSGLDINYIEANYLEFETDQRFDLITLIYCGFCALSPENRAKLLKKFEKLLTTGGRIILDVHSLNAYAQRQECSSYEKNQLGGFWSAKEYYGFLTTFKYDDEKVVLDKYTIIEPNNSYTIYNWLQYFDKAMLEQEFFKAGLQIELMLDELDGQAYTGTDPDIVVIAKRA
ncbi:class I SAM-dependent methyltransferase [Ferrimonas sp. YFM]|uniref:class I SAM-dependent methyltransferase n=1 Tax=Ferrimonas sp. YFM TaxID=3028878 RepID=UPI0025727179|nr:class I SAM-dependent methyltransferase [Ferrimonas sp. YFM]BDY05251.1 SAM-dependent methyltransferase [Ferrimonas sp. YFM]